MTIPIELLESEVMSLPAAERSHLLERLIASLDTDPALQAAWLEEAGRRDAETENGDVAAEAGEQALARLRADLR